MYLLILLALDYWSASVVLNCRTAKSRDSLDKMSSAQVAASSSNDGHEGDLIPECVVCLTDMVEPKTLLCGHSVCGLCAMRIQVGAYTESVEPNQSAQNTESKAE